MHPQFALGCLCWAVQLHSGWVTGWLQGATRHASRMFPRQSPSLRTPLLKDTISNLKLNANAPLRQPPRAANSDKWLKG